MSDRILVMREGRQMAILDHEEATAEAVLTAAMGQAGATAGMTASPVSFVTSRVRPEQVREASLVVIIVAADRVLRDADRRLPVGHDVHPDQHQLRDRRGRRGRPDARRPDPQHRPVGRLDRRPHRLRRRARLLGNVQDLPPLLVIGAVRSVFGGAPRRDQRRHRRVRPGPGDRRRRSARSRSSGSLLVELSGSKTVTTESLPDLARRPAAGQPASRSATLDIRPLVVIALAVAIVFQLVLRYLPFGRRLFAIGSNPERRAARRHAGPARRLPRVRPVRRAGRPRRLHVPVALREHHGRRRPGPRAAGRCRGRRRRRQHLRRRRVDRSARCSAPS